MLANFCDNVEHGISGKSKSFLLAIVPFNPHYRKPKSPELQEF
jgi:hypothetical protein